jgi:Zn-dependent protease
LTAPRSASGTTGRPGLRSVQDVVVLALLIGAGLLAVRRNLISSTSLLFFAVLVPSVILHEISHGVAALACGDNTAKQAGRLTLNPMAHVDPVGTIVLPGIMLLSGLGAIGWAKPVPIDPTRMRHPRNNVLLVSLTGPATNLVIAAAASVVYRLTSSVGLLPAGTIPAPMWARTLYLFGFVNVLLAVFNLLPVPPLDGSAVVERLLPASWWPGYLKVRSYGLPILIGVVLIGPLLFHRSVFSFVFDPALNLWNRLLG